MRFVVALRLALVSLVLLWATIHMHLHALVLAPPSTLLDSAPDDCSDDAVSPRATVASTMIDPMRDCRLCEERPRASAADESDAENERPCSLPLDALLRKVSSGEAEDISIDGDGAAMRVRSRRAGGRWCGGYELLAQVLLTSLPSALLPSASASPRRQSQDSLPACHPLLRPLAPTPHVPAR